MEIALCVLTYNGADIVDDVLTNCVNDYFNEGIDIYYFDSSMDNKTKDVVEKYIEQGYTNLYYINMPEESSIGRTKAIMSGEHFVKEYDYVWPTKNRSYLSVSGLKKVKEIMNLGPDVIVCMGLGNNENIYEYNEPTELYRDFAWIMTSLDAVIYKTQRIFSDYDKAEYYIGFNEFYSYLFNRLPQISNMRALVIDNITLRFINSQLGKSKYNVIDVWKTQWVGVNEQLPACYDVYKAYVVKSTVRLPWLLGNITRVVELHEQNLIREDNLEEISVDWEKVSDVPFVVVEKIARNQFDIKHDTSYVATQNEFLQLLARSIQCIKNGEMEIEQLPIEHIKTCILEKVQKNENKMEDMRLLRGSIEDICNKMKNETMSLEEYCNYLQVILNFGILLEVK